MYPSLLFLAFVCISASSPIPQDSATLDLTPNLQSRQFAQASAGGSSAVATAGDTPSTATDPEFASNAANGIVDEAAIQATVNEATCTYPPDDPNDPEGCCAVADDPRCWGWKSKYQKRPGGRNKERREAAPVLHINGDIGDLMTGEEAAAKIHAAVDSDPRGEQDLKSAF